MLLNSLQVWSWWSNKSSYPKIDRSWRKFSQRFLNLIKNSREQLARWKINTVWTHTTAKRSEKHMHRLKFAFVLFWTASALRFQRVTSAGRWRFYFDTPSALTKDNEQNQVKTNLSQLHVLTWAFVVASQLTVTVDPVVVASAVNFLRLIFVLNTVRSWQQIESKRMNQHTQKRKDLNSWNERLLPFSPTVTCSFAQPRAAKACHCWCLLHVRSRCELICV